MWGRRGGPCGRRRTQRRPPLSGAPTAGSPPPSPHPARSQKTYDSHVRALVPADFMYKLNAQAHFGRCVDASAPTLAMNCNIHRTVGSWPEPASYLDGCQDVAGVLHRVWLHHCKGPAAVHQLLRHEAWVFLERELPAQCASLRAPFAHQAQQPPDRGQVCRPLPASSGASYRRAVYRSPAAWWLQLNTWWA